MKVSRSLVRTFSAIEALLLCNSYNIVHRGMKLKKLVKYVYSNQSKTVAFSYHRAFAVFKQSWLVSKVSLNLVENV